MSLNEPGFNVTYDSSSSFAHAQVHVESPGAGNSEDPATLETSIPKETVNDVELSATEAETSTLKNYL